MTNSYAVDCLSQIHVHSLSLGIRIHQSIMSLLQVVACCSLAAVRAPCRVSILARCCELKFGLDRACFDYTPWDVRSDNTHHANHSDHSEGGTSGWMLNTSVMVLVAAQSHTIISICTRTSFSVVTAHGLTSGRQYHPETLVALSYRINMVVDCYRRSKHGVRANGNPGV